MIEIKLTCETVAEAQAEMAALLDGRPRASISGSGPKDMPPPAALTSKTPPDLAEHPMAQPANVTSAATSTTESSGESSGAEQPKRGRGRPRKDALAAPAAGSSSTSPDAPQAATPAADAGNEPSGEPSAPRVHLASGATETAEPASDAVSSTSSESAPQVLAIEQAPAPAESTVTDTELQRFCARLAQHYGGPQKIFEMAEAFLPEGTLARPTNIMGNDKRWEFIRAAEADSGLTYHG